MLNGNRSVLTNIFTFAWGANLCGYAFLRNKKEKPWTNAAGSSRLRRSCSAITTTKVWKCFKWVWQVCVWGRRACRSHGMRYEWRKVNLCKMYFQWWRVQCFCVYGPFEKYILTFTQICGGNLRSDLLWTFLVEDVNSCLLGNCQVSSLSYHCDTALLRTVWLK